MSCEAIIKSDGEIVYQEDGEEEVIEEVIEDEQVWMGEEGGYYQAMMDHQVIEYDDYQAFLPVRGGDAYWTMNLPELMSKVHQFGEPDGSMSRLITCFNRRCHRQIAFKGFLYTVKDWVSDNGWTIWKCINEQCFGEIRTLHPDFSDIHLDHEHADVCLPDEHQIVVRVGVYDSRLLAEFTDTPLAPLYEGVQERIKHDFPDVPKELFPSFESIQASLLDHRHNKIYRKRFEMQKFREKQKKMNMTADEVLFAENALGMIKPRRTKPFPMALCSECNDSLVSTNLPSQDQLIHHLMYTHGRRLTIERFEFKDVALFEHYLRELNANSRFKMKRFGLADENMYYLCAHDDRLAKNGIGRATRLQQQNCHCTAFIRIFDWRIISKNETSRITIDYCLEHQPHPYLPEPRYRNRAPPTNSIFHQKEYIDYFTPEVFIRDLEDKKIRSQKILEDVDPTSIKRPGEVKTYYPPGRVRLSFGARALAPPLAAQLAAGTSQPYVDMYGAGGAENSNRSQQKYMIRQPIRNFVKQEEAAPPPPLEPQIPGPSRRVPPQQEPEVEEDPNLPPPRIFLNHKIWSRQTERQNFKDVYTFNAVCKAEDACMQLLNRLQTCQHARIGLGYREKIAAIVRNANTDPGLVDNVTEEQLATSWVLHKPMRGRPRKRAAEEGGEQGESESGEKRNAPDATAGSDDEEDDGEMETEDVVGNGEEEEQAAPALLEQPPLLEQEKSQTVVTEAVVEAETEKQVVKEEIIPSESPEPLTSSDDPKETTSTETSPLPRVERSGTVESTSSTTSSQYVAPAETTTRSGRSRKAPARLQE